MLPVTIAAVLLAVPTFWLVMRYNLHMFQLNTYLNNEQWTWIRKNPRKQALLALSGVLGLPALALPGVVTAILVVLSWLGICKYYGYLKKSNVKKKLVFTKRVQRQAATDIALNLLLLAAAWAILGWGPSPAFWPC